MRILTVQLLLTAGSCFSVPAREIPVIFKPEKLPDLGHSERSQAIRLPIQAQVVNGTSKNDGSRHPQRALDKRGWGWKHLEDFRGYLYFMDLELGNPTQTVKVIIDTGSFEMWVNPNCSASASRAVCQANGYYDPNRSTWGEALGTYFDFRYGTGFASGEYHGDLLYLRERNLLIAQQFGVANRSEVAIAGILGLGYGFGLNMDYPNTLDSMVGYERIAAPIFAIGLGGQGDGFSEIVFGGVNRYKYIGSLEPVAIWPPVMEQVPQSWAHYWVNMTSMGIDKPSGAGERYTQEGFSLNVLIDTGSTLSYLWPPLVEVIAEQFEAWWDQGDLLVDCANRDRNGTVNFGFNNERVVIRVRYKDFIVKNQDGTCSLGVQPANHANVLGDTFIRGAYLVFDQQTDHIWMGNYFNCGDGVSEVGKYPGDTADMPGLC